ncbi:MAG TPA: carbohydrate kinase family protein [Paucimonas sp.]|nr:carbohydrate kinase family protein [Paucimonas sp.]
MKDHDVLVVGGAGVDTIVKVDSLPLPFRDSIHVGPIVDYVAHTGNGVALGCQALGLNVKFIDFIGDDEQGRRILARYEETGLDFQYLIHDSGTRRSVNLVDADGRRLSLYDGRHPADLRMPRDFYLPPLSSTRHAHISIMDWARHLYDDARELGVTISTDLHDWDGVQDYHRDFAYRSDIVFLSMAAIRGRHEIVMADILAKGRARAVVVMAGGEGSYLLVRDADAIVHFGCANVGRKVVDTNGAGDSFVAAFLSGFLERAPWWECMRRGAIGGAYACTWHGTHERFATRTMLMEQ